MTNIIVEIGDKTYRAIVHKDSGEELTNEQASMAAQAFQRQRKICMPLKSIRHLSLDMQIIDIFDKGIKQE